MNLYIRLLRVILHAFLRRKLGVFQSSVVHFFVMPTDLDLNMHMTNSRYQSLMDLGRTDLLIRTGLYKKVQAMHLAPILGSSVVRFRKGLNLFQIFTLHTRLLGWDDKWYYIEQRFMRHGKTVCYAQMKATFVGKEGIVSPNVIAQLFDTDLVSPPLPKAVELWNDMEEEHRTLLKEEAGAPRP